jgi:hypothetical protein
MIMPRPRALVATMLIACCAVGLRGCVPEDVTLNGDIIPVRVEFDARTIGDHVDVEYWVTNQTAKPILLLDWMRARQRVSKASARPVHWEGLLSPRETGVNTLRPSR